MINIFTIPCSIAPDVMTMATFFIRDRQPTDISTIDTSTVVIETIGLIIPIANCFPTHKVVWNVVGVECQIITQGSNGVIRPAQLLS